MGGWDGSRATCRAEGDDDDDDDGVDDRDGPGAAPPAPDAAREAIARVVALFRGPASGSRSTRDGHCPNAAEHVRRHLEREVLDVSVSELARAAGVDRKTVRDSIRRGASLVRALAASGGFSDPSLAPTVPGPRARNEPAAGESMTDMEIPEFPYRLDPERTNQPAWRVRRCPAG